MQLSSQQQNAVEYTKSPTLVIAGAGSGKTRTLTAKIAYLIKKGYDPGRILAITFTNKAASEMKKRLISLTGLPFNKFPWVRTYHSACAMILKAHCSLMGYKPPVQIYAMYHQQKLIKEILIQLNFDKKYVPGVMSGISNAKNSGNPIQYIDKNPRISNIRLIDVYKKYEHELLSRNAVDFDNILLLTRDLLRDHKDIKQKYNELFQYILVDEYQDTNNLQEDLTNLLMKNGNIFCVGDDWQAIYGFRGSNVDHFLSFPKKYKKFKIFRLEQNYRSANEIVQVANKLIGNNNSKMDKKCFSDKRGGKVEIYDFSGEDNEANWVRKKIRVLYSMGIPYDKMAVLYRTKFSSLSFEKALRLGNIPYRMLGGKGFFERKEILDINSYVAASVFERDDVSFERIINTPKRGVGPGTLQKIGQVRTGGMSLQGAVRKALKEKILAPKIYNSLDQLMRLLDKIRDMGPDKAIREIIAEINYIDHLKQYLKSTSMDLTSRQENIEQLIYMAAQKDTIAEYLEEAALVKEDRDEKDDRAGVALSTIHASKGLEYMVVFVVACEENIFPHWRCMDTEKSLEEERRLMYVSVTRSENYLFLSSAGYRMGHYNKRSRFLDEIEAALN
ncbi:MAG: UvrD-helicase domain-containing protein [Desulfobacteraceae bacterium]|nr:UvrD-helicase domain-containing protein [Desulfobacteraceae bacterium]